jgi:hypothetical protein
VLEVRGVRGGEGRAVHEPRGRQSRRADACYAHWRARVGGAVSARVNLTGRRYGTRTVLALVAGTGGKRSRWLCRCDCGATRVMARDSVRRSHGRKCHACAALALSKDLRGERSGRLVVLERVAAPRASRGQGAWWLCECDCGERVKVRSRSLVGRTTRSCGCLLKQNRFVKNKPKQAPKPPPRVGPKPPPDNRPGAWQRAVAKLVAMRSAARLARLPEAAE